MGDETSDDDHNRQLLVELSERRVSPPRRGVCKTFTVGGPTNGFKACERSFNRRQSPLAQHGQLVSTLRCRNQLHETAHVANSSMRTTRSVAVRRSHDRATGETWRARSPNLHRPIDHRIDRFANRFRSRVKYSIARNLHRPEAAPCAASTVGCRAAIARESADARPGTPRLPLRRHAPSETCSRRRKARRCRCHTCRRQVCPLSLRERGRVRVPWPNRTRPAPLPKGQGDRTKLRRCVRARARASGNKRRSSPASARCCRVRSPAVAQPRITAGKILVASHAKSAAADRAPQPTRNLQTVEFDDCPRIGRPPRNWLIFPHRPGKDAVTICIEQPFRRKPPADAQ